MLTTSTSMVFSVEYKYTIRLALKLGERKFAHDLVCLMGKNGVDPTEQFKALRLRKTGDVFNTMHKAGYGCDEATYDPVIGAAILLKKSDLVFLDDTMKFGASPKLSMQIFPPVVGTAVKTKQDQLALEILDYIYKSKGPSAAYLRVLQDAEKANQYKLVKMIVEHIEKNAGAMTIDMYEAILSSCARVRDLEAALENEVRCVKRARNDRECCFLLDQVCC
ncbi:hypothetical protein L917_20694 [Phytophthora nicotianae]|uniref:Uncharacterized protein n=1 Tax=Phytophthora nicotianae TaxID=4792 RepID=W2K008_PHYNI|nr:hypothetical protein L917_20694 [Phytophthora nicotianae]